MKRIERLGLAAAILGLVLLPAAFAVGLAAPRGDPALSVAFLDNPAGR